MPETELRQNGADTTVVGEQDSLDPDKAIASSQGVPMPHDQSGAASAVAPVVPVDPQEVTKAALAGLHATSSDIQQRLQSLQRTFESSIKYDAGKDKQLDLLHAELQT